MTERLREIEQRCEKATPGPWKASGVDVNTAEFDYLVCGSCDYYPFVHWSDDDAEFVANAREDIPYLLGVIKEQAERIEKFKVWIKELAQDNIRSFMESNVEHSEDAKPLDGTVQE